MNEKDFSELPELVQNYLNYLSSTKGKSDLTIQGYALDLQIFFRFLIQRRNLAPSDTEFDSIERRRCIDGFRETR